MDRSELVITALQQRLGELVTGYETQIALLRAEITELFEKEKAREEYSKSLDDKIKEV